MRLSIAFTSIIKKKYIILEEQRPPFWCTCKILCFFCQLVGRRQLTSQDFSKYCFSHDMAYWRSMKWLPRKLQGLHCAGNLDLFRKLIPLRAGNNWRNTDSERFSFCVSSWTTPTLCSRFFPGSETADGLRAVVQSSEVSNIMDYPLKERPNINQFLFFNCSRLSYKFYC